MICLFVSFLVCVSNLEIKEFPLESIAVSESNLI